MQQAEFRMIKAMKLSSLPSQLRTVSNQDGAAVLDVSRNQITTLNSTGSFIWDKLQQGRSVEQVIQDIAIEFNIDPSVAGAVEVRTSTVKLSR
jgi:hypothetical protein